MLLNSIKPPNEYLKKIWDFPEFYNIFYNFLEYAKMKFSNPLDF